VHPSALSLKQYTVIAPPEYVAHYPRFHRKYKDEQDSAFKELTAQKQLGVQSAMPQDCSRNDTPE